MVLVIANGARTAAGSSISQSVVVLLQFLTQFGLSTMYCFSQFCHICLKVDFNLKNMYSLDDDMLMFSDKFKLCIPEIEFIESIPLFLCNNCCVDLRNVHKFRELSIKNITILKRYATQIKTVTESAKTVQDQLNSILTNVQKEAKVLAKDKNERHENEQNIDENDSSVQSDTGGDIQIKQETNIDCEETKEELTFLKDNSNVDPDSSYTKGLINVKEEQLEICASDLPEGLTQHFAEQCNNEGDALILSNGLHEQFQDETVEEPGDLSKMEIRNASIKTESNQIENVPYEHFMCNKNSNNTAEDENISADERRWKCTLCAKTFSKKINLEVHTRQHTGERPYECPVCLKCFRYKSSIDTHMASHSADKMFKCPLCDKGFKRKMNLKIHSKIHSGEKPHKCAYCPKRFLYKTSLDGHVRMHTGVNMVHCPSCEKSFKNRFHFEIHFRIHTGEKPYECKICGKCFTQKNNLDRHIKSHNKDKKDFKCQICEKSFLHKFHLNRHYRIHSGDRDFECTQCNKHFLHENSLDRHMSFHTGLNLLDCPMCDKRFIHKSNLNLHIKTHLGEKPHACTYCDKSFTQKNNLTRHMKIHTGEKPHICPFCPKTFSEKFHLSRHIRVHTGERPFDCIVCGKNFTQKHILEKHKNTHSLEDFYNAAQNIEMQPEQYLQEDMYIAEENYQFPQ